MKENQPIVETVKAEVQNPGGDLVVDIPKDIDRIEADIELSNLEELQNEEALTFEDFQKDTSPHQLLREGQITNDEVGPVSLYLIEAGRYKLLDWEQEVFLAKKVDLGKKAFKNLSKPKNSSPDKQEGLKEEIQTGDLAKKVLTNHNLRLVISIAKRYIGRGMPFLDLIQEGNFGLMKAVNKFDHKRGFRFSTYATWWIRQAITRGIADQSRTIRVPVHATDQLRQIYKTKKQLTQTLKREPTYEEIGKKLDRHPGYIQDLVEIGSTPTSFEQPVKDDEDSVFGDFIEDSKAESPLAIANKNGLEKLVKELLPQLDKDQQLILAHRFGFDGKEVKTLEEVGEMFNLTRERVRQIEGKALRRLRHPSRARRLIKYI